MLRPDNLGFLDKFPNGMLRPDHLGFLDTSSYWDAIMIDNPEDICWIFTNLDW
ncbi:MAG: hypothetical protein F6J93_05460 [Oscillatoria sp. SIO1A7]|nr:hypothetical protein [Oscillatoria sp. SIO1A7]